MYPSDYKQHPPAGVYYDKEIKQHVVDKQRLTPEAYAQLLKQCPVIAVNNETSAQQAGFQLGAHYVLQKLREGFVVGA